MSIFEFPATPTQSALWFIHQMSPRGTAYNIPLAFRVDGPLDAPALRRALEALVERHEILRTVYVERDQLMQRVLPSLSLDWDHAVLPPAPEVAMEPIADAEVRRPFDLAHAGPLRVRLTSWGDERHLLVVVLHHIAADHAAVGLFAAELEALYAAFAEGRPSPLPPTELQFADYAVWTREQDLPRTLDAGIAEWMLALDGHSGLLNLPAKPGATRAAAGIEGAVLSFRFSAADSAAVRAFARSRGVSPFNVLLAGYQALLHMHTGQLDILVGTPFANRGSDERLEQVLGCFMNTLPVPVRVDPAAGFDALLQETRRELLHAQSFQNVPFDAIVERKKPHREPGLNPLYQVGFVMQEAPVQLRLAGLRCTDLGTHAGGAMYDLHLWLSDDGDARGIGGTAWYDRGRFDEADVRALAERFTHLVTAFMAEPARPLRDFPPATPAELGQLDQWNDTRREWEPAGTALDLILAQAAETPDATAVVAPSGEVTYTRLIALAQGVSRSLIAQGVKPGDLVGLSVSRDIGMLAGALGIVGAGAAYVPLDPEYPDERLAFIARESGIRALLTDRGEELRARTRFALGPECAVFAIEPGGVLSAPDAGDADGTGFVAPPADGLMYVIFTSGSTGRPKGVAVPHSGVLNFLRSVALEPGCAASDRLLAVTTLSFDIAVLELYLPLTRGGSVVIASADEAHDGDDLIDLVERHRITLMQATPSTWRLMLEAGWEGARGRGFRAFCGGEGLPASLAEELLPRVAELWNLYGPTETTVWSTRERVRAGEAITIGRPLENTTLHVLSPSGQPLPPGIPGELFIGGAGVTAGYLGRPDLTQDRFVEGASGRLYRTGDLVTRLHDGRLLCLGRLDDQVKVNGHRVELGEVEATLEQHPDVRQAAVRVNAGEGGDARLIAYVVAQPGVTVFGSELRRALRERLPDYMVPSIVLPIDALPLTPNGKVDRRALPDPLAGRTDTEFVEPRTVAERAVADVWRELLGVERVGVLDNFFEIGGHSLLAIRATARLGDSTGVRPDPRALFFQTLEQVAASLNLGTQVVHP